MNPKPTKLQASLLTEMVGGLTIHFIPYRGRFGDSYFFRHDNFKKVTRPIDALCLKGLVECYGKSPFRTDGARPTAAGVAWVNSHKPQE